MSMLPLLELTTTTLLHLLRGLDVSLVWLWTLAADISFLNSYHICRSLCHQVQRMQIRIQDKICVVACI